MIDRGKLWKVIRRGERVARGDGMKKKNRLPYGSRLGESLLAGLDDPLDLPEQDEREHQESEDLHGGFPPPG